MGHFCPPGSGSGSGSTDLVESESNPDPVPDPNTSCKTCTSLAVAVGLTDAAPLEPARLLRLLAQLPAPLLRTLEVSKIKIQEIVYYQGWGVMSSINR
jgi:hypothetical protein